MNTRRLSVLDAAEYLGVSVNAVRMRIRRGTLASEKDGEGNVWALVEDYSNDDYETTQQTNNPTSGQVEDLREQVAYLREIIATRDEELRRKDTIIMQMAQRIPELHPVSEEESRRPSADQSSQAPAGEPNPHAPEPPSPEPEGDTQRRSWWRRLLGLD